MLPTDERQQFAEQVYNLKCKHLRALVDDRALVLRQGLLLPCLHHTCTPHVHHMHTTCTPQVLQLF